MVVRMNSERSVVNTFIAELRDETIQKDPLRFRRNLERIGEVMAYELSKTFGYSEKEVISPLGTARVELADDKPVLATILRAGLHEGKLALIRI